MRMGRALRVGMGDRCKPPRGCACLASSRGAFDSDACVFLGPRHGGTCFAVDAYVLDVFVTTAVLLYIIVLHMYT